MMGATKTRWILRGTALALAASLFAAAPAQAQKKEIQQMQRDMELLMQSHRELQRSVDEKHAVLRTLIEQSLDAVNRLHTTMTVLQKNVQDVQATTGARMDSSGTQMQALADNLEELKVRMGRFSQQMADMQGVLQSLDGKVSAGTPLQQVGAEGGAPLDPNAGPPPSADMLYSNALRDFTTGKLDLARQEFSDYLRFFPETDLASNAQFYLGEILYNEKKFGESIAQYDLVLDKYPRSFKLAAARFKKALALIELGQRASGLRELREVARRHPGTEEARRANAELRRLGAASPGG